MPPLAQPRAHSHFTHMVHPSADPDFTQVHPGLWVWQAYDPAVKTDLFSTAIAASSGVYLIDPIPLPDADLETLGQAGPIAGIIVTNANHQRSAFNYSQRFGVPIFGHAKALSTIKPAKPGDLSAIIADLEVVEILGAVAGEIALYQRSDGGTLIIGDALINLEAYGFTFLPQKYCLDQKQMRRSLRNLLPLSLERLLFAHGTPIVTQAGDRLRTLLQS